MRFGFMEDFRNPLKWRRPFPDFYEALLHQIERAEDLGYDHVWLTEHHFTEDGYNPSLLPTAAAIASRTTRIRIGTFILLLPYQHPVRCAEDVACVDIFSNGRFDFGASLFVHGGYSWHADVGLPDMLALFPTTRRRAWCRADRCATFTPPSSRPFRQPRGPLRHPRESDAKAGISFQKQIDSRGRFRSLNVLRRR